MRCCRPRDQHHQNMIRLMSPLDSFRHRHTSTASCQTASPTDNAKCSDEQFKVAMSATITKEEIEERMKKPLIQYSDMPTEMGHEAVEIVTMGLDKHGKNYEAASSFVKQSLDKKFGSSWHCAIGEGFGFDITCQRKFLLHVYYGKVAALCYKSG